MILLLGGTSESLDIADLLDQQSWPYILTVVSDYGQTLAAKPGRQVQELAFSPTSFIQFCHEHQIQLVIDATHPFAKNISQLVIEQTQHLQIPYIRFERANSYQSNEHFLFYDDAAAACEYLQTTTGRIYLSTGSNTAAQYAEALGVQRLHIRILPTLTALSKIQQAGFHANQIDALQGPFSKKLNIELFQRAQAKFVLTKESGTRGGIQEKMAACVALKIVCIIIKRPQINYPRQVNTLRDLKEEVKQFL